MRKIISALFGVLVTVGLTVVAPASAEAYYEGFDRGYIIADEYFYDGNAMTASQIQSLLNDRGQPCGNNNCLKNLKIDTEPKKADKYCRGYIGKKNETVSQIIEKVGKACGISQKVLLVKLQKEQGLVEGPNSRAPSQYSLDIATGYACPDTGPNNSANCDPDYFGFFEQVYGAAWLLKYYEDNGNYPVQTPNVFIAYAQFDVCKPATQKVYIVNNATAALYTYTPYTPHDNQLQGKPFKCGGSTINVGNGQLLFYGIYSNWFGLPNPKFAIAKEMQNYHGNVSWIGIATANPVRNNKNGGGVYQKFTGGYMFKANNGAAVAMRSNDEILKQYLKQGVGENPWGWPVSSSGCNTLQTECAADFTNANVVWSKNRGLQVLPNSTVQGGNNSSKDIVGGRV